jgi:AAA+ superfamily predicted ATPase
MRRTKDAVDNATKDIQSGLEKLRGDVSENVNKALADLSRTINDAVESQSSENAQGSGG